MLSGATLARSSADMRWSYVIGWFSVTAFLFAIFHVAEGEAIARSAITAIFGATGGLIGILIVDLARSRRKRL